jgi:hypothetical protein
MRSCVALIVVFCSAAVWAGEFEDRGANSHQPSTGSRSPAVRSSSSGWAVHRSANFRVCTTRGQAEAISYVCETLRTEYQQTWLEQTSAEAWSSQCEVVIHPTVSSYLAHVGRSGNNSSGCSTIKIERGEIVSRRIDIRADGTDMLQTALPHELIHVVLADAFVNRSLPRWADEGIAVLADPHEKQHGRHYDLHAALNSRRTFRVAELVSLEDYPGEGRLGVFYSQSGSLVDYLVKIGTPGQFLRFVQEAGSKGYDSALRNMYDIDGVADLERRWLTSVGGTIPARSSSLTGLARSDDDRRRRNPIARMSRSD